MKKPFTSSARKEVDITLDVLEGQIPSDIYGHVFFQSPCGTVNNALPIQRYHPDGQINKEYGGPVFNGDGMILRFDMDEPGKIKLKSRILKTPCYHADEATRYGTEWHEDKWGFNSLGIARTSLKLGSRNQVNTAVTPFKFPGDKYHRMTANFDMGRPYEMDVKELALKTPIGANTEWHIGVPKFMNYPFPLVQTTAHSSFDPETGEYFTVNFVKTMRTMFFSKNSVSAIEEMEEYVERELEDLVVKARQDVMSKERLGKKALAILNKPKQVAIKKLPWWKRPIVWVMNEISEIFQRVSGMVNVVYLLRWTGSGKLNKWKIIDHKTKKPIKIVQCMHQTGFSKDYIVLIDSSFKFAVDIMLTNPFPYNPTIDQFLREITAKVTEPRTTSFVIRRSELDPSKDSVEAREFIIPLETVHFSLDYENPDGVITMHAAHNTASCAAEWVRPYDDLAIDTDEPIHPNTVGLMTCGQMDIGRIGKIRIDGPKGEIIQQEEIAAEGFLPNGEIGAHTWAIGLHTYNHIISPDKNVDKVKQIFWQSYGLDPRILTKFIMNLYLEYDNRIIPVQKIIEYTKKGIPFALVRQNTGTMQLEDFHLFKMNENLRSLQFIPRKSESSNELDDSVNGYIFCTMVNGPEDMKADEYSREVWIFDAANLAQGPLCKLSHPDMDFAFTIHSTWLPEVESSETDYNIPVKQDYQPLIDNINNPFKRKKVQEIFDNYVYPHYN
ncbi:carotenoid oxygenase family protein [Cytophagales bacterium LB-30]|uniref:Carotenoid oxygenase family protein n=1 Tax=Shiella aurantiaca TaxID=3058365 RepID=A0ABT8F106_9BACT|nr:carotenoid oxygenase family protein [Shiella aurantiaca]MDN4164127.1 carotenoid oxygenase family protein [Shiella aurantiaca]